MTALAAILIVPLVAAAVLVALPGYRLTANLTSSPRWRPS